MVYPGELFLLGGYIKVAETEKNHYSICSKWFPRGGRFMQASEMSAGANSIETPSSEIKVSGSCIIPVQGMNMKICMGCSGVGLVTLFWEQGPNPTSWVQLTTLLLQGCSWWLGFGSLGWSGCSRGNWEMTSTKFPLTPGHKALRTGSFQILLISKCY